jgi:enoyl-CoA hydratase/carnithine racemase
VEVGHVHHGVLEIRLAGGDRRNVLGRSTIDRIEELVAHPPHGTRAVVITAASPDFCAGYDLVEASRGAPEDLIAHEENFATLRRVTVPIIVALQGNVIGGGLELALSADIRIASPETRFAIPAGKLGLVYSEAGIRLVVTAVGESVARALFLGGRDITAEAALAMGLITEIVGREQLRDRAIELAAAIASWSETATMGNRQILDAVAGRIEVDTSQLRLDSFAPNGDLLQSIRRFVERRSASPGGLVK